MAQIAAILNETGPNKPYFVAYALRAAIPNGTVSAAPLKVVETEDGKCPYLGVYHNSINSSQFATYLACSADNELWSQVGQIHVARASRTSPALAGTRVWLLYFQRKQRDNHTGRPYLRLPLTIVSGSWRGDAW